LSGVGPDGRLRDRPVCKSVHHPYLISRHYPERLHDDPYESSVLWSRAYLEFNAGRRGMPPGWVGDGVRGGTSIIR
jgi:hypothetical protein